MSKVAETNKKQKFFRKDMHCCFLFDFMKIRVNLDLDLSEIYFFCQITNHHNLCIADYAQDNISSDMDRTDAGESFRHRRNVRTGDAVFAAVGLAVAAGVGSWFGVGVGASVCFFDKSAGEIMYDKMNKHA